MRLTRRLSPRVLVWLAVGAVGLLAGVVLRRLDLIVLAAPFALVPLIGLAGSRGPGLTASTTVDRVRLVEGDELVVALRVSARRRAGRIEIGAVVPVGCVALEPRRIALRLAAAEERVVELRLRCDRWGTYAVGGVALRVTEASGLATWLAEVPATEVVRVHPAPETIRTVARALDTQLAAGSRVARDKAPGIEHADLRAYVPGDPLRDVNWRATARRAEMWVNERHPERTTDVVVFLDAFVEADVVRSVHAAVTVASAYLAERDRVGLVTFGGSLSWVRPGAGRLQEVRMIDHLLGTIVRDLAVWRDIAVLPPGTLPPRSLVLAVSSLEDDRAVAALADLRDRAVDLAVIEVVPADPVVRRAQDELALRLWRLERDAVRSRLRRSGIAIAAWPEGRPVDAVLGELREVRRRGRLVAR